MSFADICILLLQIIKNRIMNIETTDARLSNKNEKINYFLQCQLFNKLYNWKAMYLASWRFFISRHFENLLFWLPSACQKTKCSLCPLLIKPDWTLALAMEIVRICFNFSALQNFLKKNLARVNLKCTLPVCKQNYVY